MSIAIECPGCRAGLQVPDRLAGKKIRCTTCREEFRVGGEEPAEDFDDEPRPRRRRSKQRSTLVSLLIAGGILAFCLLVAVGVVLWIATRDQNPARPAVARPGPGRPVSPTAVPAQYTIFPPQQMGKTGRLANFVEGTTVVTLSNFRRVESMFPDRPTYQVDYKWIGTPPQRNDQYSLFVKVPAGIGEAHLHLDAGRMVGNITFWFFPGSDPGQGFDVWIGQVKPARGTWDNKRLSNVVNLK